MATCRPGPTSGIVLECGQGGRAPHESGLYARRHHGAGRTDGGNRVTGPRITTPCGRGLGPVTERSAPRGRLSVELGLRENWLQFSLLVIVNICVGGLVGLERTTVPLIGTTVFGITSDLAVFSFIIAFGITKAFTNLAAGALTASFRRKQLLLAGWAAGVPVLFMLAWGRRGGLWRPTSCSASTRAWPGR